MVSDKRLRALPMRGCLPRFRTDEKGDSIYVDTNFFQLLRINTGCASFFFALLFEVRGLFEDSQQPARMIMRDASGTVM